MARQHDRGDGTFGRCDAKNDEACPFSKRGLEHFDTEEDARAFLEKQALENNKKAKGRKKKIKYIPPTIDENGDFQPEPMSSRLERWVELEGKNHTSYSVERTEIDTTVRDDPFDTSVEGLRYESEAHKDFSEIKVSEQSRHCKKLITRALRSGLIQLPEGKKLKVKAERGRLYTDYTIFIDGATDEELYKDEIVLRPTSPYDKLVYNPVINGERITRGWMPMREGYAEALYTTEELIASQYKISVPSKEKLESPVRGKHVGGLYYRENYRLHSYAKEGSHVKAKVLFNQYYAK